MELGQSIEFNGVVFEVSTVERKSRNYKMVMLKSYVPNDGNYKIGCEFADGVAKSFIFVQFQYRQIKKMLLDGTMKLIN